MDIAAQMFLAYAAHVAGPAIEIGPEGHSVANGKSAVTRINDYTAKFVSHVKVRVRIGIPALALLPHVNVASADAAGADANLHRAWRNSRHGNLAYFYLLRPNEHCSLHCL